MIWVVYLITVLRVIEKCNRLIGHGYLLFKLTTTRTIILIIIPVTFVSFVVE